MRLAAQVQHPGVQGEMFYNRLLGCSACLSYVTVQSLLTACFSAKAVTQQKATEEEAQYENLVFENTVRPELRQMFFSA